MNQRISGEFLTLPKYSIIIPTRNGSKYITDVINSVLLQDFDDYELLVSDNFSSDQTASILSKIDDPNVKTMKPPKPLSMTAHYEWCLSKASGNWITIIGDDDGVMLDFFEEAEFLTNKYKETDVEAIYCRRGYFFWPGCNGKYADNCVNVIGRRKQILYKKPKKMLFQGLANRRGYSDFPQIYTNGIIKKELISRIIRKSKGVFFNELNPDVYSGVVVSLEAKNVVFSYHPIFWTGTSPKSIGFAAANMQRLKGQLNSQKNEDPLDFFKDSEQDNISVSEKVGLELWKKSRSSPIYLFSAFDKSPYSKDISNLKLKLYLAVSLLSARPLNSDAFIKSRDNIFLNEGINWPIKVIAKFLLIYQSSLKYKDLAIKLIILYVNQNLRSKCLISKNSQIYHSINVCNDFLNDQGNKKSD
jgi:glycosyltransferase involved in cell wall biosynthesis